ncbi:MAG: serine hydrolase domain-containing protein [Chloroflexota bacterium]
MSRFLGTGRLQQAHRLSVSLLFLVFCVGWLIPAGSLAQEQSPSLTDQESVEAFVDELMAEHMAENDVPGATIAIVYQGEVVLQKGYGYANLADETPVDDTTPFRLASVTKLFTAMAVMQLAEQDQLDLHTDVNRYLETFQIPSTFDEPITLHHLLTHTSGLTDRQIGSGTTNPDQVLSLGTYLSTYVPERAYPPGQLRMYSNYGIGLAGYVVEQVTGVSYEEYVSQSILQPLEMDQSNFAFTADTATGYSGRFWTRPVTPLVLSDAPAGALYASAADMNRFMLTHLQSGMFEEVRLLEPETLQQMHSQQFTHHPDLEGSAYGFIEQIDGDRRAIWHNGALAGYRSMLYLLPDEDFGVFVANNSDYELSREVADTVLDQFFPVSDNNQELSTPVEIDDVSRFAGQYTVTTYERATSLRFIALTQQTGVSANADNTLTIFGDAYRPVAPLLFQEVNGTGQVAFAEDETGRITHMFRGGSSLERTPWWRWTWVSLGFIVCIFLFWSVFDYLIRKSADSKKPSIEKSLIRWGGYTFNAIAFFVGLGFIIDGELYYGTRMPLASIGLNLLWIWPLIGLALVVAAIIKLVRMPQSRLHWYMVGLGSSTLALCGWLYSWNLLGAHW